MNAHSFSLPVSDHTKNSIKNERRALVASLYAKHAAALRELAARIGGESDADDAVHDAFVELLANPRRLPNKATLAAIVRGRARRTRIANAPLDSYDPHDPCGPRWSVGTPFDGESAGGGSGAGGEEVSP